MKTRIKSIVVVSAALPVVWMCVAAVSPAVKPLAPYEREQTKGKVRVVLLKVERATIFSTDGIRDPQPGKSYPVPMVGVTYMIEALGSEPIRTWIENESADELLIGNRRVREGAPMPENLIAGSSGGIGPTLGYSSGRGIELPKSFVEKRSVVSEIHERAVPSKTGTMRLKLHVGFNDQKETFIFENIPLN